MYIDKGPNGTAVLIVDYGPHPGRHPFRTEKDAGDAFRAYQESYGTAPASSYRYGDATAYTGIPEEPSPAARIGRGSLDRLQGIAQTALMGADLVSDVYGGSDVPSHRALDYTRNRMDDYEAYQRGAREVPGFDWYRALGTAMTDLPTMKIGAIAGPVSSTALNAGLGGTMGALTFAPGKTQEELNVNKVINTGAGAVAGAAVPWMLKGGAAAITWLANEAVRMGGSIAGRVRMMGPGQREQVAIGVGRALSRYGLAWDDLGDDVQRALYGEATRQMQANGRIDSATLARAARLERYQPTAGQVTRDPAQWAFERNTARSGLPEGQPLRDRFTAQTQQLVREADAIERRAGGVGRDAAQAGGIYTEAAQTLKQRLRETIDGLYKAAGEKGREYGMLPENLLDKLDELADNTEMDAVVDSVMRRLQRWPRNAPLVDEGGNLIQTARTTRAADLAQAEELRKFIGKLGKSSPTAANARKQLLAALDRDIDLAMNSAGELLPTTIYGPARAAAADHFTGLETKVYGDILPRGFKDPKVPAEKFFESTWLKSSIKQTEKAVEWLRSHGPEGETMLAEARRAAIRYIKQGAGMTEDAVDEKFSAVGARNALRRVGLARLRALFYDQQDIVDNIRLLTRNAAELQVDPQMSNVNYSGTGGMLMSMLRKLQPQLATQIELDARTAGTQAAMQGHAAVPSAPFIPPTALGNVLGASPARTLGPLYYEEARQR